ncbi:MAG: hypothetical protein AB7T09_32490, partial [Planctomycetota bacterium]
MRILVTGSAGHLGEGLVRTLLPAHEVRGLDLRPSPFTHHVIALRAQRRRPGSSLHVPWHDLTGVEPVQSSRHAAPEWLRPT